MDVVLNRLQSQDQAQLRREKRGFRSQEVLYSVSIETTQRVQGRKLLLHLAKKLTKFSQRLQKGGIR